MTGLITGNYHPFKPRMNFHRGSTPSSGSEDRSTMLSNQHLRRGGGSRNLMDEKPEEAKRLVLAFGSCFKRLEGKAVGGIQGKYELS